MISFRGWFLLLLLLLFQAACQSGEETEPDQSASPTNAHSVATSIPVSATPAATSGAAVASATPAATMPAAGAQSSTPVAAEVDGGEGGNADVTFVRAVQEAGGDWTFHVTVAHPDAGWEDYADGWDVVTPSGDVVKRNPDEPFTRVLLHPHVDEQPFTRSQSGLALPPGVEQVTVRAHDLVAGFGGQEIVVDLTEPAGPGFEVERGGE